MKTSTFAIAVLTITLFAGVNADYTSCYTNFESAFTDYLNTGVITTLLSELTEEVCYPEVTDIQNSMKPTICSFTSFFAIDYLADLDASSVIVYIEDYCNYLNTTINEKITTISTLSTYDTSSTTFNDDCVTEIYGDTNKWFDPVIPSTSISMSDMCTAIQSLYLQLEDRDTTTISDYTIYTYVLIYQMYLNAMEESSYEQCVDESITSDADSGTYCQTILSTAIFTLWSETTEDSTCIDAEVAMETECASSSDTCYPCAYTLSYVFTKYEDYVTQALEDIYSDISDITAVVLYEAYTDASSDSTTTDETSISLTTP